jgi:hypothetical protein
MTEPLHPALAGLPAAYGWLIPELAELELPHETRATCGSCAMVAPAGEDPDDPRYFHEDVRCCGYHPSLPNHRVGQLLAAGGRGAELVRRRLAEGPGANEHGLDPGNHLSARPSWWAKRGFGRDVRLRCPYWVGGELACGIWEHREAVCRTWHCRHVDGVRGMALWSALRAVLSWVEDRLSVWLVKRGARPAEDAAEAQWVAWYEWCARTLAAAAQAEIEALADAHLARLRADLRAADAAREAPWPGVVEPAVRKLEPHDGGILVTGAASFDPLLLPASLFAFLSQLDGARAWTEALAAAGEPAASEFTAELVHEMLLRGVLRAPGGE